MLYLLHGKEFVNMNDLLPNNRTQTAVTGNETIVQDATTKKFKVKTDSAKKAISIASLAGPASSVCMAYGIAINPCSALPLTKYID